MSDEEVYPWEESKNKRAQQDKEYREREKLEDKRLGDLMYEQQSATLRGQIAYLQHLINQYDSIEDTVTFSRNKISKGELEAKRDEKIKELQNLPNRLQIRHG
jgi:hypothetical protein